MASTYVVNYADARLLGFPVSGAGSNIPAGTVMMPGATGGTNLGVLIPVTAASNARGLGILADLHNFSASGDATTATLVQWFPVSGFSGASYNQGSIISPTVASYPSHAVDLYDTMVAVKMDYAISNASAYTVTSMTGATVINNATFPTGYDSAFVYFSAGTAIGELGFLKSSISTTSATLSSALTTTPVAGDTMVLINPLFWETPTFLVNTTTAPTQIDTKFTATNRAVNLANFISLNGLSTRLDPKTYHNAQKLNSVSQLGFYSYLCFQNSAIHPNS